MDGQGRLVIWSLANRCGSEENSAKTLMEHQDGSNSILENYLKRMVSPHLPWCTDADMTPVPPPGQSTGLELTKNHCCLPSHCSFPSVSIITPNDLQSLQNVFGLKRNQDWFKSGSKKHFSQKTIHPRWVYRHIQTTFKEQIILIR